MTDDEEPRPTSLTKQFASRPPARRTPGLALQVGAMMLLFLLIAGALAATSWVLA